MIKNKNKKNFFLLICINIKVSRDNIFPYTNNICLYFWEKTLVEKAMDYEKITDRFIQSAMESFNLLDQYQEFLDSLVEYDNFSKLTFEEFQKYLDNLEVKK